MALEKHAKDKADLEDKVAKTASDIATSNTKVENYKEQSRQQSVHIQALQKEIFEVSFNKGALEEKLKQDQLAGDPATIKVTQSELNSVNTEIASKNAVITIS